MPTALYRRYRPESFADVIGQEHVTGPLMQALRADRTNHAYLFSGPRGCGKTTSARILARCLNCAQGPTDTPCGQCESCRDLARDGGGSMDVVEIDAASHGGVDDARELRERAAIAPARDRFKIFIVDEAHMVTSQGFNAMLKLVEEPPPHVKFVFATTEPDKVLPTIRSRTHHYPFHLVAPGVLSDYLSTLCEQEHVPVGPGVIPLVVRAGAGSVRDSLSVLDQLMAGADESGLDQARAAALLGFTEGSLLDDVINAITAVDGAALFGVVDRVLSSGQDPRRFVEDLLARLRDLIVVSALQERSDTVLQGYPKDQLERLSQQAAGFRPAELSRAADVVNDALADMVGASGPRIQLELLCARLLLPSVDGDGGYGARLDRMERVLSAGVPAAAPARPGPAAQPAPAPGAQAERPTDRQDATTGSRQGEAPRPDEAPLPQVQETPRPTAADPEPGPVVEPAAAVAASGGGAAGGGGDNTELLRRFWPDILNAVRRSSRATWSIIQEQAQVLGCSEGTLTLGIANPGALRMFVGRSSHAENLAEAVKGQTNLVVDIEAVPFDRGDGQGGGRSSGGAGPSGGPGSSGGGGPSRGPQPSGRPAPGPGSPAVLTEPERPAPAEPEPAPDAAQPVPDWPEVRQPPSAPPAAEPDEAETDPTAPEPDLSTPAPAETAPDGAGGHQSAGEPPGWDEPPFPDPQDLEPPTWADQPVRGDGQPVVTDEAPPEPPPSDPDPAVAGSGEPPQRTVAGPEDDPAQPVPTSPGRPSRAEQMAQAARRRFTDQHQPHQAPEDAPSVDDPDAEDSGMVGRAVVERLLGGRVIDEM